jgi:meso-butanediol dehydrogenase/(S,S)-butanediol dehydrogenase/diacetyl reductase
MRGLEGKNVLVTGGASGIGQATATRFLEEGCAVCVLDRSADARVRVAEELPALAAVIDADVSDMKQVRVAFQEALECMGSVDVLINNAGISIRHDFLDITPENWDAVLGVNLAELTPAKVPQPGYCRSVLPSQWAHLYICCSIELMWFSGER